MLGGRLISQRRPGGSCVAVRPVPGPSAGATAGGGTGSLLLPALPQTAHGCSKGAFSRLAR